MVASETLWSRRQQRYPSEGVEPARPETVRLQDGRRLAYAFLINNVPGSLYPVKGVQDDFLRRLMTLPAR